MLILIAEAKTMTACADPVQPQVYAAARPALEAMADDIMHSLRGATAAELSRDARLSPGLASALVRMVYDFSNKSTGGTAIRAYSGVVFKALDYATLPPAAQADLGRRVRIISSLYGWLRPDDIIKPYRLDFTTRLAPDDRPMAAYLRDAVTDCLLAELQASGCADVLDLLPADAARCIDWKRVASAARVWKAEFREPSPDGTLRTPNAGRLKTLRGRLLRHIVTEAITSPDALHAPGLTVRPTS